MRNEMRAACLAPILLALLAACGQSPATPALAAQPATTTGPVAKPGGGLQAERSGAEAQLDIMIQWSATIVVGVPAEGLITSVYHRKAELACPITSSAEAPYSWFAAMDNPNGEPLAATGAYQPWWNEDCTGTLTIDDTYHADDPTIAGPEPIVHTRGTRPLRTADTPLTVETDLNRARTRYLFIAPSTNGFQQEAAAGYPAKLVPASAAPMATMDFTLEGPIGGGKRVEKVQGGTLQVDWTFTRGRKKP
jgi:hypothetical protein